MSSIASTLSIATLQKIETHAVAADQITGTNAYHYLRDPMKGSDLGLMDE